MALLDLGPGVAHDAVEHARDAPLGLRQRAGRRVRVEAVEVVAVALQMVGGRGHEGALVGPHGCLSVGGKRGPAASAEVFAIST